MRRSKKKKNQLLLYVLVLIVSFAFIILGYKFNIPQKEIVSEDFVRAKITKILKIEEEKIERPSTSETIVNKIIKAEAKIIRGEHKGETIDMVQYIDNMYAAGREPIKEGSKVILTYAQMPDGNGETWIFANYDRINGLLWLCLVFLALIIVFSMKKGVSTVVSLCFTSSAIFFVYIPAILAGRNIYITTIVISIYIVTMSLTLMNGINIKTLCAILGNFGGLLLAGIFSAIVSKMLGITGFVDEDYIFLLYIFPDNPLDLRALIWGGIVIGSLGAIMDVAMAMASSMKEVSDAMVKKSIPRMISSGLNIGRDAIGTMTNTLILAYIGGSLATVILLVATNKSPAFLFNMEMIIVEILQSIAGSIGIVFAVPMTVITSAYLYKKEDKIKNNILSEKEEDL